MCSIVDGAFPEELPQKEKKIKEFCQKCNTEKPILTLRKKDVYCKACFLINCNHKFRSTLGKNKAIRPNDKILIGFSGSQGSLAVLKLIRNSLEDKNNPKKVNYQPQILIIDENSNFQYEQVLKLAQKFNFPIIIVHLNSIFEEKSAISSPEDYKRPEKGQEDLEKVLNAASDQTARNSLLKSLKRQVLIQAGDELKCGKIFTGESATSLAITLLSGVALGRGAHVGNEAGFCDHRNSQIQVLRPLREFSVDEVAFFNVHDSEEIPIPHENEGTKEDLKSFSIEKLTETFVTSLQEGFPSTVPTIFATGNKLLLEEKEEKCVICDGEIDIDIDSENCCTALEAAKFSKLVSEKGPTGFSENQLRIIEKLSISEESCENDEKSCSGEGLCGDGGSCNSKPKEVDFSKAFCYSCSTLIKDPSDFPTVLKEAALKKVRQEQMKHEIQDFLL